MNSKGIVGNKKIIEQIDSLIKTKRIPHAIILEGENGIGKKTLARFIAASLVCRGDDKPCYSCSQCSKASQGIHPDIIERIATGGAGSFHVDSVRQIINDVYMKPNEADYKIYILGNADCMNESAQNALLKVLEEPPSYIVFILTVSTKSLMLPTVLSRCVSFSLDGVDAQDGARYICDNISEVDYSDALFAVETFNGNIGKAIESFNDSKTTQLVSACSDICRAIAKIDEYEILKACAVFQKDRQAIVFASEHLKSIFRDALFYGESDITSGQPSDAKTLSEVLSKKKLLKLIAFCDEFGKTALMNVNNNLIITKICYGFMQAIA